MRETGLPFPVSPPALTVALCLDYQTNPLCWGILEALRGLFQVLHRSLDLRMLLASNTATVETLKVRCLETESSLPFTKNVPQDRLSGLPFPYLRRENRLESLFSVKSLVTVSEIHVCTGGRQSHCSLRRQGMCLTRLRTPGTVHGTRQAQVFVDWL